MAAFLKLHFFVEYQNTMWHSLYIYISEGARSKTRSSKSSTTFGREATWGWWSVSLYNKVLYISYLWGRSTDTTHKAESSNVTSTKRSWRLNPSSSLARLASFTGSYKGHDVASDAILSLLIAQIVLDSWMHRAGWQPQLLLLIHKV